VDVAINVVIEELDRDGFKFIACGDRPAHKITRPLAIVLDDDNDEGTLRQRTLGDISEHWADLRLCRVEIIE